MAILSAKAQPAMVKTKIGEEITLLLPEDLIPMTDEDFALKFISPKKPLAVYTNHQRVVEFSINESNTTWKDSDLELMKSFYKSSILSLYDQVKFLQEDIQDINKKKFVIFEFTSRVKGDKASLANQRDVKKYTYIQYTIKNGKTVLLNFNCPLRDQPYWQPVIKQVMGSIRLK
ncbi:MAG: hypothetical protein MI921_16160 [Cytophagales bacterium]|nr:hypothetical protein [Cytophagales bacterium]